MGYLNTILPGMVMLGMVLAGQTNYTDKHNNLAFTISLDKDVYRLSEFFRIKVLGTIMNNSSHKKIINSRYLFPTDITIHIRDENQNSLKWLPPSPPRPLQKEDFITLSPGQYSSFSHQIKNSDLFDPFKPGRYKIQLSYIGQKGDDFGLTSITGTFSSNEVSFEIK